MIKVFTLYHYDDHTRKIQLNFEDDEIFLISESGNKKLTVVSTDDSPHFILAFNDRDYFGSIVGRIKYNMFSAGVYLERRNYIIKNVLKREEFSKLCKEFHRHYVNLVPKIDIR
jgi:hypothetical protein